MRTRRHVPPHQPATPYNSDCGELHNPPTWSLDQNFTAGSFLRVWQHDSPCGWRDIAIKPRQLIFGGICRDSILPAWNGCWGEWTDPPRWSLTILSMGGSIISLTRHGFCQVPAIFGAICGSCSMLIHVMTGYFCCISISSFMLSSASQFWIPWHLTHLLF